MTDFASRSVKQRTSLASRDIIAEIVPYCAKVELVGSQRLGVNDGTVKILACPRDGLSEEMMLGILPSFSTMDGRDPKSYPKVVCGTWRSCRDGIPVPVEIVMTGLYGWGVLELFHTGPEEFVKIVEERASLNGLMFVWTEGIGFVEKKDPASSGTSRNQEAVFFPSEDSLFRAVGMRFVLPEDRIAFCRPDEKRVPSHGGRPPRTRRWPK